MPRRLLECKEIEMEPQPYRRTGHIGMSEEARLARMSSIGGSDAKIIMSGDQKAIERLWHEKRGEQAPVDLSEVILINLGNLTEPLNADLFEKDTGWWVTNEQDKVHYADWDKAHTTLDGLVRETPTSIPFAVVEFKFMFPFGFDLEKAIEKYYPQCQHNMMVTDMPVAHLSILTGAAQWYRAEIEADIFYQVEMLKAEKAFWKCVEDGTPPGTPEVIVPLVERIKIIDMSTSNEWASEAEVLIKTVTAVKKHEKAKKDIKKLMPPDAKQASGKGVTIKLSRDGKMLIDFEKDAVEQADKDSNLFPPEASKPKKPRAKKAANSNEEPAADAA
jgi:predicted phage-related endonuclease